jgi:predicted TIM-barrel fold metal-dependent hydrolase
VSPCVPAGFLAQPLPALSDPEGARLPESLPPVIDAHVHLFDTPMFEAIWRWFEQHAWPVRYRLEAPAAVRFLLDRGVERIVALHYAHKPGIARGMNAFVAAICAAEPRVTGLATVFPGEPGARAILDEARALGLAGVKLHCHVQCFAPDADELDEVYAWLAERDLPLVIHAGREPKSPAYRCDPHLICSADRIARVLAAYPTLRVVVPHLGSDEYDAYERLLERHENLWLDTTMVVAGYFPEATPWRLLDVRPDRVLYGTDFPNLPYAWDREIVRIAARRLDDEALAGLLGQNARRLYGLVGGLPEAP